MTLRRALLLGLASVAASGPLACAGQEAHEGFAEVNGTRLRYEVRGEGFPVVLLHGGNLDLRMWDDQMPALTARFRVIRFDARGFGRSARWGPEPFRADEDLLALLDHLGIERAHLVGLSLGGRVAIDFALEHPERVDRLVLAAPGLSGFAFESLGAEWERRIGEAIGRGDSVRATELWLESGYMAPAMEDPGLAPRLRAMAMANSGIWVQPYRNPEVPLDPTAISRLGELRAPTLLVWGDRDVADILRIVDLIRGAVPGVVELRLPGAGHMVNLERRDDFNRAVVDFLR